mmetsp:Transcript_39131/g.110829  ORF Transcript_39131/g.110829 Transcript_39131/m.110829 type:complete len:209 (-) Transcript_39131:233-859(-)
MYYLEPLRQCCRPASATDGMLNLTRICSPHVLPARERALQVGVGSLRQYVCRILGEHRPDQGVQHCPLVLRLVHHLLKQGPISQALQRDVSVYGCKSLSNIPTLFGVGPGCRSLLIFATVLRLWLKGIVGGLGIPVRLPVTLAAGSCRLHIHLGVRRVRLSLYMGRGELLRLDLDLESWLCAALQQTGTTPRRSQETLGSDRHSRSRA